MTKKSLATKIPGNPTPHTRGTPRTHMKNKENLRQRIPELHEVKKSKAIEEAGIWQLKYYLYYLKKRGVEGLTGKIDYPLAKRNIEIELTDEDCRELDKIIDDINKIKEYKLPPELNETKICKKCAYFDMCFI